MNQQELILEQRELLDKGHSLWVKSILIHQGAFTPFAAKKIIIPISVDRASDMIKIKWDKWSKTKEKWAAPALALSLPMEIKNENDRNEHNGISTSTNQPDIGDKNDIRTDKEEPHRPREKPLSLPRLLPKNSGCRARSC